MFQRARTGVTARAARARHPRKKGGGRARQAKRVEREGTLPGSRRGCERGDAQDTTARGRGGEGGASPGQPARTGTDALRRQPPAQRRARTPRRARHLPPLRGPSALWFPPTCLTPYPSWFPLLLLPLRQNSKFEEISDATPSSPSPGGYPTP